MCDRPASCGARRRGSIGAPQPVVRDPEDVAAGRQVADEDPSCTVNAPRVAVRGGSTVTSGRATAASGRPTAGIAPHRCATVPRDVATGPCASVADPDHRRREPSTMIDRCLIVGSEPPAVAPAPRELVSERGTANREPRTPTPEPRTPASEPRTPARGPRNPLPNLGH